nr:hypothetical protein Itr_chr10CG01320 [Ipomoea trifida]
MEQFAGDSKGKRGGRLEDKRESEGVWGGTGAEHLPVNPQAFFELALLGKLPQLGVPSGGGSGDLKIR